jgi:hypothetical protein
MRTQTRHHREGNHFPSAARSHRPATAIAALVILCPMFALAQVPPRFYWQTLSGANAVPVIFQSLSGNVNPMDPSQHIVNGNANANFSADVALAGYAKVLPLFDRSLTLAVLEPMGRISSDTTFNGRSAPQDAKGFGDPMLEVGYNLIGPKALKTIPDMLRYEPKFSLNVIADVYFPVGEYQSDEPLNLGQNRWYGRVGAPIIQQIGPWVPGRRITLEVLPSVWFFSDNNDYYPGNGTLSTDPIFQLEAHLTRDLTEKLWVSADTAWFTGGKSSVNGVSGDSLNNLGVGFTLGYSITDNLSLTAGYMSTVNDNGPNDVRMDGFRISLTYGWHKIIEGQKRLKSED